MPGPLSSADIGSGSQGASDLQEGPAGVVARWLTLLSLLVLGGVLAARPLLADPAAGRLKELDQADGDASVAEDARRQVAGAVERRTFTVVGGALLAFVVGSLLLLLIDAAAAEGDSLRRGLTGGLFDHLATRPGVLWLMRTALGALLAVWLLVERRGAGVARGPLGRWAPVALVATMLLMTSLSSHSAALEDGAGVGTAVDWVHLLAGSLWIGGLVSLGLVLLPALAPLGGPARTRLLAYFVPRFSTIALASVVVLVLTGAFQTWQLLDPLRDITRINWGKALLVKLALVLALIGLGAVNLLVIRPRLRAYAGRMDQATRERAAGLRLTFRRVVLTEAALGVVVLLVVGVLTGVSPSRAALELPEGPFRPFVLDQSAEDLSGRLVLSPGRIGNNRFDLSVREQDGRALPENATAVLRITTLDQESGVAEVRMETLGPGRFTAAGSYLSIAGLWEVAAIVRRPGTDDVTLPFRLSLTEATGRPQAEERRPAAPLARGREIYQQNCAQCHGVGGRGDGPLAAGLRPPPVDLTVHVPLHGDATLAGWIANGIPRTAMPAFGGQFSEEEIQAVINYLRDLARQSGQDR